MRKQTEEKFSSVCKTHVSAFERLCIRNAVANGNTTWYYYDGDGIREAIEYNGNVYYYFYNAQGDVIGILDSTGTQVVEYTYNAWGEILSITGTSADTIGQKNPLRYRGYYYDAETGLYYLLSRYYDSETGRFINADGYVSTGQGVLGNNMFTYCGNNPVNNVDHTGAFWSSVWNFVQTAFNETVKAVGGMSPAYEACGRVAEADGPFPYGDIAGTAGAIALTVGAIAIGIRQAAKAPSISIPKVEEKEKDITAPSPSTPTVIYRYGGTNPGSFVPSERDVATNSGLSFLTRPPLPGTKAAVTTIEALNATGVVIAYQDRPGHVRVDPVVGTLAGWRAGGSAHPCTIAVKSVVLKWN